MSIELIIRPTKPTLGCEIYPKIDDLFCPGCGDYFVVAADTGKMVKKPARMKKKEDK